MHSIPVQPDQPTDEQLEPLLALVFGSGRRGGGELGRGRARLVGGRVARFDEVDEGVVEEHGVTRGAVDDAV